MVDTFFIFVWLISSLNDNATIRGLYEDNFEQPSHEGVGYKLLGRREGNVSFSRIYKKTAVSGCKTLLYLRLVNGWTFICQFNPDFLGDN